jgi:alpha-beta hydrolase superfamily lysophospholipase
MTSELPTYAEDLCLERIEAALPAYAARGSAEPEESWLGVGHFDVHLDHWRCPEPRATLVLLHGGGGHGRLLAPFARMAVAAGATAVAPDLPGYGLTQVPDKRAIRYQDWRDVAAAVIAAEAGLGRPVIAFGLSMGGMLAYDGAALTGQAAAVVATCFLDVSRAEVRRGIGRWPWLAGLSEPLLRAAPGLTDRLPVPLAWVANMAAIANDPEMVRAIVADPRAGGNAMPLGFLRTFLEAGPVVAPGAFDTCPVVLAHPGADRWTPPELSLPFYEALTVKKRLVMLDNAGHLPVEQPGFQQLQNLLSELVTGLEGSQAAA